MILDSLFEKSVRRKVFISYHHYDQEYVNNFIDTFENKHRLIISRSIGISDDDFINSENSEYIISQIRQKYMQDSTITIVLIGECTWSRKFIDWEIKASLRQGDVYDPNGLIGIYLPYVSQSVKLPPRLEVNLPDDDDDGYARVYPYPYSRSELTAMLKDAIKARQSRSHLIDNPQETFINNRPCKKNERHGERSIRQIIYALIRAMKNSR